MDKLSTVRINWTSDDELFSVSKSKEFTEVSKKKETLSVEEVFQVNWTQLQE